MVDMHSHIIPGVDDGSGSVEETFNMIKEAVEIGFTDIVLTSHYLTHYYEPDANELIFWKEKIQEILDKKNINIKLHSGMEVYISNSIDQLFKDKKLLTINGSKYLLMELPLSTSVNYFDHVLFFLDTINIIPIMAHPERYKCVQENPNLIDEFIEKKVLIQCNYGSIVGLYGRKAKSVIKMLLKEHKVHFLGSDCHKQNSVYKIVPGAIKKIKKITGDNYFKELAINNPKRVLENKDWEWSEE